MRAIAVLLIVTFHVRASWIPGGYIGVDIFFVLSGYLITGLLLREVERTGTIDFAAFYARRIRRLLPAAMVALCATMLAVAWIYPPTETAELTATARATAGYISNLFFAASAADYFAPSIAANPLLHTWSLSVEEQFYAFWPIIILGIAELLRSARARAGAVMAVGVLSFAAAVWVTRVPAPGAFYHPLLRAWEFAAGGVVVLVTVRPGALRTLGGWIGLLVLGAVAATYSGGQRFPGTAALVPALGTVLFLLASDQGAASDPWSSARVLAHPVLRWIGQRSYSWYLWHWPALVIVRVAYPAVTPVERVLVALAALAIAALTYAWVEQPIRRHYAATTRPWPTFVVALSVTLVLLLACNGLRDWSLAHAPVQEMALARSGAAQTPGHCFARDDDEAVASCTFGDSTSTTVIVLYGDSHAWQWLHAIATPAQANHWRVVTFFKSGCPVADVTMVYDFPPYAPYPKCLEWRASALRAIAAWHPAVVVMSQIGRPVRSVQYYTDTSYALRGKLPLQAWSAGMERTVATLDRTGAALLWIADTPFAPFNPVHCVLQAMRRPTGDVSCAFPRDRALRSDVFAVERAAMRGASHGAVINLSDAICGTDTCLSSVNGTVRYVDDNHLSEAFTQQFGGVFQDTLTALIRGRPLVPSSDTSVPPVRRLP